MSRRYVAQLDGSLVTQCFVVVSDTIEDPAAFYAARDGGAWANLPGKRGGPGWRYAPESAEVIYPEWVQVSGADAGPPEAESGYPAGYGVWHAGAVWTSTTDNNVWEPGVANWHRADGTWVQPTGATDAYATGAEVQHAGAWWRSLLDANIWEPSAAVSTLWQQIDGPGGDPV